MKEITEDTEKTRDIAYKSYTKSSRLSDFVQKFEPIYIQRQIT